MQNLDPQSHFTAADQMPWTVNAPFRVAPGLHRLQDNEGALFVRDDKANAYRLAKQKRLASGRSMAGVADERVLRDIAKQYESQYESQCEGKTKDDTPIDPVSLSLQMQEDFVILHDHAAGGGFTAEFFSVCFPSNWRPIDKLGKDFLSIHAPVADNAMLLKAREGVESIAFRQQSMVRHVWLLSPTPDLAQDPEERGINWQSVLQATGNGSDTLLSQVYFRVERQSTLPLPEINRAVFFIRIMVCPLLQVLQVDPSRAQALSRTLASMSEAFLHYRGMQLLKDPLCEALERFATGTH
jgi:dimethylamine monooxygenase subunit A